MKHVLIYSKYLLVALSFFVASVVCMDPAYDRVSIIFNQWLQYNKSYLFGDLTDRQACRIRLADPEFNAALAVYRNRQIAAFQSNYSLDSVDNTCHNFPEIFIQDSRQWKGTIDSTVGSPLLEAVAYGPSGNYIYAFVVTTDKTLGRIRCRIDQEGILDLSTIKPLKHFVISENCRKKEFVHNFLYNKDNCVKISLFTEQLSDQMPHNNSTLSNILIFNAPTKKPLVLQVPAGSIRISELESGIFKLIGYAELEPETVDFVDNIMASPWEIRVSPGDKNRELHFHSWFFNDKRMPPLLFDLLSSESVHTVTCRTRPIKRHPEYKQYVPYFNKISAHSTVLEKIAPCDTELFDILMFCSSSMESWIAKKDLFLLIRNAIALQRLSNNMAFGQCKIFNPKDVVRCVQSLAAMLLKSSLYKIQEKNKNPESTLLVNAYNMLIAPTLFNRGAEMTECAQIILGGPNRRAFLRVDTVDEEERFSLPMKIFSETCHTSQDLPLEDVTVLIEKKLRRLTRKCARTMWDNGEIGATWRFDREGMRVSLYDFNAQDNNNVYVATYLLKHIKKGKITHIRYPSGFHKEPIFYVNDKKV